MATDDDILSDAKEAFDACVDAESNNRTRALDDLNFARLGIQWPEKVARDRERDGRPCLTRNKMPSFIRQVVNDARQNKPAIKVRPVDSGADIETANVISGLIRNIEQASNADVAYDTAADFAVTTGLGYIKVDVQYAHNQSFDREIVIERVANPFAIYGDPYSMQADSSDWNTAFETEFLKEKAFKARFGKNKDLIDWDSDAYSGLKGSKWHDENGVLLATWWSREEVDRTIYLLSNGVVIGEDEWSKPNTQAYAAVEGITVEQERMVKGYKITSRLMTGAEVIEENEWMGEFIPVIPVYGDEVNVDGERHFLSLIHHAKDAQREYNYWHTTSTELVGLQPKAPYIGEEGAFSIDPHKWETANTDNYAYLEFKKGAPPPQRQPYVDTAAGAIREGLQANDDMKSIIGIYDASLGARSNETSGVAIRQRQQEGDVSTFHFIDNLSRAIRHTGRVIIDLIPHVYTGERMVRVLGEDGVPANERLGERQPYQPQQPGMVDMGGMQQPQTGPQQPEPAQKRMWSVYDLSMGKYDLAVQAGPSFTTRRQEAAEQMMELLRVLPGSAPYIGDLLVKNLDWPQAEEIAERLKAMAGQGDDPRIKQAMQVIQQLQAQIKEMGGQIKDKGAEQFIKSYEAETKRIAAVGKVAADMAQADAAAAAGPLDAAFQGPLEGGRVQ